MARKRNRNRQPMSSTNPDAPSEPIEELEGEDVGEEFDDELNEELEGEEEMSDPVVEEVVEEAIPAKTEKFVPTSRFVKIRNITNNVIELWNPEGQVIQILPGATNRVPSSYINETDSFLYRIVQE